MIYFKATRKSDGYVTFACAEDNELSPPGMDPGVWDFTLMQGEPTERDSLKGALATPADAEVVALEQVELEAEKLALGEAQLRRQVGIMFMWNEVQRLKLAQATGNIPADLIERSKQFPTLMALVSLTGNTLAQVATAAENRLWDRVRRMALYEAQLMLARDSIRQAATIDAKLDAVASTQWGE